MANANDDAALVLFSGGQDSTVCLAWALARFGVVETVGFRYGQRHAVELDQRPIIRDALAGASAQWAERLGADHMIDLSGFGAIGDTALTSARAIDMAETGLPTTFVPGRNLVFLTAAAALGYRRGIARLVGGMCETDYSGYPDCRSATIAAQEQALRLGLEFPVEIATPLMRLSKAQTWVLADDLGGAGLVEIVIEHSHTCYLGDRTQRWAWGYGCGACPACTLRAQGHAEWAAVQRG